MFGCSGPLLDCLDAFAHQDAGVPRLDNFTRLHAACAYTNVTAPPRKFRLYTPFALTSVPIFFDFLMAPSRSCD